MHRNQNLGLLLLFACSPPAGHGDTGAVDSTLGYEDLAYRLLQTGEASGGGFLSYDESDYRENTRCEDLMEFNVFTDYPPYEDWVGESLAGATLLAVPDWSSEIVITGTLDCSSVMQDFDVEYVRLDAERALQVGFLHHNVDCLDDGAATRYFTIIGVESVEYTSASAEWREEMETGCYE